MAIYFWGRNAWIHERLAIGEVALLLNRIFGWDVWKYEEEGRIEFVYYFPRVRCDKIMILANDHELSKLS